MLVFCARFRSWSVHEVEGEMTDGDSCWVDIKTHDPSGFQNQQCHILTSSSHVVFEQIHKDNPPSLHKAKQLLLGPGGVHVMLWVSPDYCGKDVRN